MYVGTAASTEGRANFIDCELNECKKELLNTRMLFGLHLTNSLGDFCSPTPPLQPQPFTELFLFFLFSDFLKLLVLPFIPLIVLFSAVGAFIKKKRLSNLSDEAFSTEIEAIRGEFDNFKTKRESFKELKKLRDLLSSKSGNEESTTACIEEMFCSKNFKGLKREMKLDIIKNFNEILTNKDPDAKAYIDGIFNSVKFKELDFAKKSDIVRKLGMIAHFANEDPDTFNKSKNEIFAHLTIDALCKIKYEHVKGCFNQKDDINGTEIGSERNDTAELFREGLSLLIEKAKDINNGNEGRVELIIFEGMKITSSNLNDQLNNNSRETGGRDTRPTNKQPNQP